MVKEDERRIKQNRRKDILIFSSRKRKKDIGFKKKSYPAYSAIPHHMAFSIPHSFSPRRIRK